MRPDGRRPPVNSLRPLPEAKDFPTPAGPALLSAQAISKNLFRRFKSGSGGGVDSTAPPTPYIMDEEETFFFVFCHGSVLSVFICPPPIPDSILKKEHPFHAPCPSPANSGSARSHRPPHDPDCFRLTREFLQVHKHLLCEAKDFIRAARSALLRGTHSGILPALS